MSTPRTARVALENLAADAKVTAPGEGRRPVYEAGPEDVRMLLDNFRAITPMETEEADACIQLTSGSQRVAVRHAGGRLILVEGESFSAATVENILDRVFGSGAETRISEADDTLTAAPPPQSQRGKYLVFVLLVGVCALVNWLNWRPQGAGGIESIPAGKERQAILSIVSGTFAGTNERLQIEPSSALLTVTDRQGSVVLRTAFRVGRSKEGPVLVTGDGAVYDVIANGIVRIGDRTYTRSIPNVVGT